MVLGFLSLAGVHTGGASGQVDSDTELADQLYSDYGPCPDGEIVSYLQWEDTVTEYQNVVDHAQLAVVSKPIDQIDQVNVLLQDGTGVVCAPGTQGLLWTGASFRVLNVDGDTSD